MRRHYAWVVFAVAFVTLLGASGFRSTPAVLIDPLREDLGWSRATVGTAVSINVILFGLMGPFAAALQARYGLVRVTVGALTTIASGAALTAFMTEPWQLFFLWGGVVGAGSGCLATVFASSVASRRSPRPGTGFEMSVGAGRSGCYGAAFSSAGCRRPAWFRCTSSLRPATTATRTVRPPDFSS